MKGLVDRGQSQTLELLHVDGLRGEGNLTLRDGQTATLQTVLSLDGDLLDSGLRHHLDDVVITVDGQRLCLAAHIAEAQLILGITYTHGEVTVHVGHGGLDDTSVAVNLADRGTHQLAHIVGHPTVNSGNLGTCADAK